jgi:hypothetical protein
MSVEKGSKVSFPNVRYTPFVLLNRYNSKQTTATFEALILNFERFLLPPFITRLIQKYAAYMQRQGLPRIPEEAIR